MSKRNSDEDRFVSRRRPFLDRTKTTSAKIISTKTIVGLEEGHFGEDNLDEGNFGEANSTKTILNFDEDHFGEGNFDEGRFGEAHSTKTLDRTGQFMTKTFH